MSRQAKTSGAQVEPMQIIEGYRPGLIGRIVSLHAETYSQWAGFGSPFESKVARELADFVARLDRPANTLWHAASHDQDFLGSIAIDGEDLGDGRAHLRWFIVDPALRSKGVGRQLLQRALAFADNHGFRETHLWTLKGLEAARVLYERSGFTLYQEFEGDQWGERIIEQTYIRKLGAAG